MANKKVIKSSIIVMVLIIIGKVLALIRDSLIAAKFGATYVTDIYNFALGLIYLITTISYGLTTTFIPVHTEHIKDENNEKKDKFVNNVITVSTLATIFIIIILFIFTRQIIYIFGHGFGNDPKVFQISVDVTRIMLLSLIFMSLQSVLAGVLQSHKEFFEPAAMAAVSNVVYIIYLVYFTAKYGIKGFAVATVAAFFMQFIINVPKYKKLNYTYKPVIDLKNKEMINMFKLMIPVVISTSVVQLNSFVNRAFATNIFFGAVTVLDCANKINTLAYEVFAIGIAMIVYPTLSELAIKEDKSQYKKALGNAINIIMIIMIPAAVAIGVLRMPLTVLIFKRGAFSSQAAELTANALLFYCPAMIAYGVRDILNKAFYAVKDTSTPMINSFIGIIINIIINFLIVKYMMVSGLTLATTISAISTTLLMMFSLNKKLNGMELKKIGISFLKITLSASIMGIVLMVINNVSIIKYGTELKGSLISISTSFILGSLIYFVCLYIAKVEECKYLTNIMKRKLIRK